MEPTIIPLGTPGRDRDPNSLTVVADGIQMPRLSTAERLALALDSRFVGFTVYDVTTASSWTWTGTAWAESATFDGTATNTEVLYMDGAKVAGDPAFTWNKATGLNTVGVDSATAVPIRRQLVLGNVRVTAGTNNPNGVEFRVIGPTLPYHSHQMINGLANGFAANSDHTHCTWNNFSSGTTQQTQIHQEVYTVSAGTTSFVSYGYPFTALGTEFTNEVSIDTTGTVQNPVAPDFIGRIVLRYSTNPGIAAGENLLLQVINVQVAGIQAAVYAATSATASTLVGALWEVQVDVVGLDAIHWNWNNRANTTDLTANWQLNRTITPLTGLVSVTAVGASDTSAMDLVFNPIPAQLATSASIGYPITFLIKQASSLTGISTGNMYTGCVTALTYAGAQVTARVRLRNVRYQFWQNIGGADANPSRFNVYPGVRDVAHDPHPFNTHTLQYRNSNGIPRCVSLGGNDFTPTVNRAVALGMNLIADTSDEVVLGTDNVSNKVRIRSGGIQLGNSSDLLTVYRELSSWTPVLTSSTGTFTITVSDRRAFRVGSLVTVSVTFVVGIIGGAPTDAQLSLPTAVANSSALTFGYADSLDATAKTQLMARVNPATSLVDLFHYDNGTVFDLGPHINVGTELTLAGTYVAI